MAEGKNAEQEPSIEEILDSIRQIISDDEEQGAPPESAKGDPQADEDVIELTEQLAPASPPEPARRPEPEFRKPEPKPIVVEMEEHRDEPKPRPERDDFSSVLSKTAESAAYEGFSELARKATVGHHNGITIEEIVRTELRPLLKDWLNKNLPPIIERLVREELERVAKKAMED